MSTRRTCTPSSLERALLTRPAQCPQVMPSIFRVRWFMVVVSSFLKSSIPPLPIPGLGACAPERRIAARPPFLRHPSRRDAPPPLRHRFGDHGDDGASLSKGMPPPCHSRREGRRPREGAAHRGQVRRSEFDLTGSGMASGSGVPSEETARRPRGPVEDVVTGMDRLYLLPNRRKGRLAKDSELRTQLKWLHNRRPLLPNDLTAGSAKLAASSAKLSMLQNRSYPLPACRVLLHNSPAKLPIILDMMHNLASGWRGEHDMQHFKVGTQHRDSGERLRSPGERLREES